ncbi:MAG: hypothetical protein H6662_10985 [Ardenticatenaceae bacterium]|nr:hypothetical protein [Anaerolineales bacterium]MCB8922099.1 hypothetical protein [Ardenticatenaceae bacterium]MCB9003215.1 hypothetical protein [Ardenticatenaceae bacterium]
MNLVHPSPSLSQRRPNRLRNIIERLLISIMPIILFFALLEFIAYRWEQKTAQGPLGWTLVASRRMPTVRFGSAERPYNLLTANQTYNWEGIPVHINTQGLRDDEIATPKPPNTIRILNLGDSVAFGWEVRQEETYGNLLEEALNAQNDGLHYEVINAGVPGWNLCAETNYLLQEGLAYQPNLILLDITVVNDICSLTVTEPKATLFTWLRDHTYSWPFLTTEIRFLLARKVGPEAIPVLNPPLQAEAYYPLSANSELWDKVWQHIVIMQQAAQQQGIDLILVVFPTAYQVNSAHHPTIPQDILTARAAEAQIPLVDMLPIFKKTCEEAGGDACEGYENLLFADVWMHPNALGHQLTAEALFTQEFTH